jgi:hypothetical protein
MILIFKGAIKLAGDIGKKTTRVRKVILLYLFKNNFLLMILFIINYNIVTSILLYYFYGHSDISSTDTSTGLLIFLISL